MRTKVAALAIALFTGCGIGTEAHSIVESRLAKTEFALTETDSGVYQLFVTRDAITNGTQFLLSTSSIVTDFGDPQFSGSLSRVVTFKLADGKVQMLEGQKGNVVDATLVKPNIIASFPIASETDTAIGLAFNEGMATLLLSYDWGSLGTGEDPYGAAYKHDRYKLTQRYIDDASTDTEGRLTIHQLAEVELYDSAVSVAELRYFFQPYTPDPTYKPLIQAQDYRTVGYFESSPNLIEGTAGAKSYISRFNPDKPLVYAISANTPEEVKPAVRDGILYWNRVLGREFIQVIDAPVGIVAPSREFNIVQWIPERGAAGAYADAQVDPLTGEVQNAQVFFPSAFYLDEDTVILDRAARRLNKQASKPAASASARSDASAIDADSADEIRPTGRFSRGCNLSSARAFSQAAKLKMKLGLTDEQMQRAALDYVRSTVAHEVGHTLGLSHNFAGSLGTNIAEEDVPGILRKYFETGEWPEDAIPGSTVMEYAAFEDDVGIGAKIRLGQPALDYDVAAITNLYDGTGALLPAGGPMFCSDLEADLFPDCTTFDRGADITATLHKQIQDSVDDAAVEYLYWLRAAKDNNVTDLFQVTDPVYDANAAYGLRFKVATLLSDQARLLRSDRAADSPFIRQEEIHEDTLKRVGESVEAIGGYDDFFALLPRNFDRNFNSKLNQLLRNPQYVSGTSYTGVAWTFSADELQTIRDFAPDYLKRYHDAADKADVAVLSLQDPNVQPDFSSEGGVVIIFGGPLTAAPSRWEVPVRRQELEQLLTNRVSHYVTTTDGSFTALVAQASEPVFDDGGEGAAPAEGQDEGKAPERAAPSRDASAGAGAVPQSGAAPSAPVEEEAAPAVAREMTLPKFKYATEVRAAAPSILDTTLSEDQLWTFDERGAVYDKFAAQLAEAVGDIDTLELAGSDDAARQWILDNREVFSAVSILQSE